jgi:oxygen-independent coproporphyrinogen-3 oxidase
MMVTHRPEKIEDYLGYLMREVDLISRRIDKGREVVQMHWGGGTPTYLNPDQIERLMAHVTVRLPLAADAEVSIEADPRGLTTAHLEAARRAGFNRISFGVQDFDPDVQLAVNRIQPEELVAGVTADARRLGFSGINYDLIYGLPNQTLATIENTVRRTIALAPDRISLFGYAHVPWMKKHQHLIDESRLPEPEEKIRMLMLATQMLTGEGGYRHIGMDHFARPDDSLSRAQDTGTMQRNFQGYSTRAGGELYAFGLSAISQLEGAYAQNALDLRTYYKAVDAGRPAVYRGYRISEDDRLRRYVIMRLMCDSRLDLVDVEQRFGINFATYFSEALSALRSLEEDDLVWVSSDFIQVSNLGRYFIRNIAMPFDAYLNRIDSKQRRYSQAV